MSILSREDDWGCREEPISEVYLVFKNQNVIAVYTPSGFRKLEGAITANPSLSFRRAELDVVALIDLFKPNCKGCSELS